MRSEKNVYLYNRLFELLLGIVCFGLFTYYFIYLPNPYGRVGLVEYGIAFVAADAFPFLVQIPFLIAYKKHGKSFQHNILNPIVNLVGGIVYLSSGAMGLHVAYWEEQLAVGSMFTVTGIVYLMDLCYWMMKLRKAHVQQPGVDYQSPPYTMPLSQPYNVNPNQQYGPPMFQPYNAYPSQQNGPPVTQQYIANPNQQNGPPMTQQYIANPNQQFSNPGAQPYVRDQPQQFSAPMGQRQY